MRLYLCGPLAQGYMHNVLLESLLAYPDKDVAKATSAVLGHHMWYLSDQLVALAFFNSNVSLATERDMVKAYEEQEGSVEPPRRVTVDTKEAAFTNKTVADFVTTGSMHRYIYLQEGPFL